MENQLLEIKVAIQIQKPVSEVFEAIADPAQMTNYFISESSGRMEENKELVWKFPEFDDVFKIRVGKVVKDEVICYSWDVNGYSHLVEITFKPALNNDTIVVITEKDSKNTVPDIEWLKGNTQGWANFLACLKAYTEYGINLRKGAFDYMKK